MATQRSAAQDMASNWLVPILLSALLTILGWMSVTLSEISATLAVAVSRVEALDIRLTKLESQSQAVP